MNGNESIVEKLRIGVATALAVGAVIFGLLIPFLVLAIQGYSWLELGEVPEKDLYFLLAEPECEATNWQPRGWEGMEVCRQSYINFTDWVGVDKMLNYIFDLSLAVISMVVGFCLLILMILFVGWSEEKIIRSKY